MENTPYFWHPEIANAPLSDEYKYALQIIMDDHCNGDFDKLLSMIEGYMVDDEDYESAAIIRDYRDWRKLNTELGLQNS